MKNIIKNNFVEGLIWNYGSVAILSVSGFLLNFLIIFFYDATALGVFSRAQAWYGILSQITVWGVHMSIMKLIPECKDDRQERESILSSAFAGVLAFSVICVVIIEAALPWIITNNRGLLTSMQMIAPALVFFSLNKVLLNYLNGLSEMKAYAFLQSLRYIIIVITILLFGILRCDHMRLTLCFLGAEIVVFAVSVGYLIHKKLFIKKISLKYVKEHAKFGTCILMSNMVTELNTKVDIICLGFILGDDYLIGIYSFAVLFADGFYQLFYVVRRSINPKITEYHVKGKLQEGIAAINANLKKYLRVLSPLALAALGVGYYILCCLLHQKEYLVGLQYLLIICTAIILSGRKIILGNIFAQTGFPTCESIVNTITVVSNFSLNIILIYIWGLSGAALATAVSYIIFGCALRYYANKELKVVI